MGEGEYAQAFGDGRGNDHDPSVRTRTLAPGSEGDTDAEMTIVMRPSSAGTIPTFAKDFIGDNSPATLPPPVSMPSLSGLGSLLGGMPTALAPAGSGNSSGTSLVETFQSATPYASRGTDEGVGRQTHVRRMPGARRRGGLLHRKLLD